MDADARVTVTLDRSGLWMVQRPRLLTRLHEAAQRDVTLVVAPLGYGKRTLIDQWIARQGEPIQRLDGSRLTALEVRAARRTRPGSPTILVVDRADQASVQALESLLDLLDHGIHLVLTGISRPPLTLGALTARGQVHEITAHDLAFTRAEVRALLETSGPLPDFALDTVMETSLGWPAPVRLLSESALSYQREASQLERLYAFFAEEIYPLASDDEIELLQTLSVLPSLTPSAIQALTGDRGASVAITALATRGFPLFRSGPVTIIHPLVRRHLTELLVARDPARHQSLASLGIEWLSANGEPLAAMRLALDTGVAMDASTLLRPSFMRYLHTAPRDLSRIVEDCAVAGQIEPWEAAAMRSILLAAASELDSDIALDTVEALVVDDLGPIDRIRLAGFQLYLARQRAYAGVELSGPLEVAAETAASPQDREALPHLALLQVEVGFCHLHHGSYSAAHDWLVRGHTTARLTDLRPVAVQALAGRSWVTGRSGGVPAARRLADEAIMQNAELTGHVDGRLVELAWLTHAQVDIDAGLIERADSDLAAARRSGVGGRETAVLLAHLEGLRSVMTGDVAQACAIVERCRAAAAPLLPMEEFQLTATELAAHLVANDDHALTTALIDRIDEIGRPEWGGTAHFRAHHLMRLDRFDEAFALLDPVVQRGEVTLEKEWLQLLMAYALACDRTGRTELAVATFAAADELASRLGMGAGGRHNLGTMERRARVQFTEAELHLLRNLRRDESVAALAKRLFVSPNTVKTHLRRIYRKLAVANRDEAIERAQVLRLL